MSTTKRSKTTTAKKTAKSRADSGDDAPAKRRGAAAVTKAAKPGKKAPAPTAAAAKKRAKPVEPVELDDDDDDDEDDEKDTDDDEGGDDDEVKPAARGRGGKKAAVEAAPAPPKPAYTLDGPAPPEAAGLPKKVGALLGIGQQALGIQKFRPGQAEAFGHLLAGEDLLAVMPTGSGKSLLYQLPSLVLPGVTVVVSPLIALIKDQIDKMVAKGVTAMRIDSTLTVKQRREVDALIRAPGGKLLLTTPERMADPEFRVFLREAASGVGVSRFVVDEAHCVSQWGHDFRPAYLSLRKALEDVGRPPVLATTATAPPHVRDDILFQLGIEGATIVTTTFDRPNLHYEVIIFSDEDEKMKTLVTLLKKLPRPGIVYCATVKKVEELYEALTRWGVPVGKYHGRMNKGERDASQNAFMESSELVMVATNAFGLGVDKPNIRNVLHYHVPGSLEAYAQEAGRGGRDGKPARCVLLFSPDDVAIQEYFLSGTYPTKRQVRQVYEAVEAFTDVARGGGKLAEDAIPNVVNLALSAGVGQQRTRTVLSLLKDEQFIVEREGGLFFLADPPQPQELLLERAKQYEARRIADRQRLDALLAYVKAPGCRNQVILQYLGEPEPPKCGRCDNCLRSREAALAASTEATRLGASVTRQLDDDGAEQPKPRREIRARVVRIDQPPPETAAATAPATAAATAPAAAPAKPATVLRRSAATTAAAAPPPPPKPTGPTVFTRKSASATTPPVAATAPAPAPVPPPAPAAAPAPAPAAAAPVAKAATPAEEDEELDDDLVDDDELDDDELEDGEDGDDEDDDEDDDDGDDDEDGELVDDEDDDEDDDDEDDDDLDDEDDDDEDDDDEDDDDYEVIDKTAAELAEEGVEGSGEITVLARKKQPKQPKQRPQKITDSPSASAAEARRRRRRRRRKRRAMLPPKSAFTTPVLSTAAPIPEAQPRRNGGGGGPVIEYVRGPMRIATAPVASANPNDAGVARRRGKKRGRWERNFDRQGDRREGGGPRFEYRNARPGNGGPGGFHGGPGNGAPAHGGPGTNGGPGNGGRPQPGWAQDPNGPGERRRRRRRRRKRGPIGTGPMSTVPSAGTPADGAGPGGEAPVSFFQSTGPVPLGPDGQPLRKRRRRRRRGRGGRQREWRGSGDGSGGPPAGDGGGGGGPGPGEGGGAGGGGGGSDASAT